MNTTQIRTPSIGTFGGMMTLATPKTKSVAQIDTPTLPEGYVKIGGTVWRKTNWERRQAEIMFKSRRSGPRWTGKASRRFRIKARLAARKAREIIEA